jgi:hypothetical protein
MENLIIDFKAFRGLCIIIKRDYNTYKSLYFSGNDDLLKKVAGKFFFDISEILVRDWILQVSRIMDPAETKVKGQVRENLTIKNINKQLESKGFLSKDIKDISNNILQYGKKLQSARNKIIAHVDRETYHKRMVLGETTELELNNFLVDIQKYCDLVGVAIKEGPLDFRASSGPGDVLDLIRTLKKIEKITN